MNNKQILIQTIIGAISEEAIASIYKKAVADNNSQGADFPTKFSFYISIFYQDSLIKSRTLNWQGLDAIDKKIEDIHVEIFEKYKDQNEEPVFEKIETQKKKAYCLFRVGYFTIIVSDDNKAAVELCAMTIALLLTINKAAFLIKEWGHFHDIKTYCTSHDKGIALNIINQIERTMYGKLGGHK